jgi:excisionase family DNA binding protein
MKDSSQKPRDRMSEFVLITLEELAEILHLSSRTLQRKLSAGELPTPIRIGRSIRWQMSTILKWIQDGCPVRKQSPGGC